MSHLFASGGQSIYWSFSFSISPSSEHSMLASFRIDWFDLLAVQGTQEFSPALQLENINSSVLILLYGSVVTSVRDYLKGYNFDYTNLCQQSNVSDFEYTL